MFEQTYPLLSIWVEDEGRIEIGADYYCSSILRLINEGGLVWEDEESVRIDDALNKAEKYLQYEFEKEFGYKVGE